MRRSAVVTGAGGFIGHHLVKYLKERDYWIRGVDRKLPEFEPSPADEFELLDLRDYEACLKATVAVEHTYHLAAEMGGIGFISANHADVTRANVLMDAHMLEAAYVNGVTRFFYSSSACVYPLYLQHSPEVAGLKEEDAWPAEPEEGYGLEKLYAEKLCEYYQEDKNLETRVARFHNVYGSLGSYDGGREKAPAAFCRKVALADDGDEIEIWGDGLHTRSFMYVGDCIEGIFRIMQSDHRSALNLGSDHLVTVKELVELITKIAGKELRTRYDTSKPQGVRGRNSDNSKLRQILDWEPSVTLAEGLAATYEWIEQRVNTLAPY